MSKSMTGFGKAQVNADGMSIDIEIKSLNGRNLEINTRMPRQLNSKEFEIRDMVKKNFTRASVNLYINLDEKTNSKDLNLNEALITKCSESLNNVKKQLKIKDAIKMEHIIQLAGLIGSKESEINEETLWKNVKKGFADALKELDKMRKREGQHISKDIEQRINKIHDSVKTIESLSLDSIPEVGKKYREKIARLLENDDVDEQRLATEIVILSDKLDVSEECVRLYSHIKLFKELLLSEEPTGRKLNFLVQELHREINTIGSKSGEIKISHYVVGLKEELERIREQIQNLE